MHTWLSIVSETTCEIQLIINHLDRGLMLGEGKYSPGVGPALKAGSARFLEFYKTLVNNPDPGVCRGLCKVARSRVCKQGGIARSGEGSHIFSSN